MNELLSTKEVALKVGLSQPRINQLITSGVLPAQKIGNIYVVKIEDLSVLKNRPETRGRKKKVIDSPAAA